MAKYEYLAQHVSGKFLYAADALSRAPNPDCTDDTDLELEVEAYLNSDLFPSLPATPPKLMEYVQAQIDDPTCAKVREYCETQWPSRNSIDSSLKPYWKVKASLTLVKQLLLYNNRIVVPLKLRKETLENIHEGHQGIERSRLRAQCSVWWPCVTAEVKQYVENCRECAKECKPKREPLISTPLPDYPWQMVGTDLFELKGQQYLVVVDYYSRYPECIKLSRTTSAHIITVLKAIFARHGIPETVRSDNGPQFSSHEFTQFAQTYGFKHTTSSPHYPQSNGAYGSNRKTHPKEIGRSSLSNFVLSSDTNAVVWTIPL
ncbi:uncharacterized protein K02A2.6-like [Halichondria panicea]|uniref:uncharacterized protein K02A2.6-like n=1 Tax=Halichondria panicea TaxID=6063 RepID=UPI00312B4413